MSEHTKEPWHQGPYYKADIHASGHGEANPVANCGSSMVPQNKANAARIVACVNALAGIETDKIAEFVERAKAPSSDAVREAAIQDLLDLAAEGISYSSEYFVKKHRMQEEFDRLKAALAENPT